MMRSTTVLALSTLCLSACGNAAPEPSPIDFTVTEMAQFNEPWALHFLPDGSLLVTEKPGVLKRYQGPDNISEINGVPPVVYGGQGGLGDVVPHPDFENNGLIYLSYAEAGEGDLAGAAVARARLSLSSGGGELEDLEVIWRQTPKKSGRGHYGHRIAFSPQGELFISSGERQEFDPAQDMSGNLGKILRLNDDGSLPDDNPFAAQGDVAAQVWSLGHRNPLGLAFDSEGQLWNTEMGPRGGDELNRVQRAGNYGYPEVSDGSHYDMRPIPDHDTRADFITPAISWSPVISPGSLMFYGGSEFPEWQGSAFVGGLSSQALVRVRIDGELAEEAERFDMGQRIRGITQGPDGALWVIEDERNGRGGRLLRLSR